MNARLAPLIFMDKINVRFNFAFKDRVT